MRAYEFYAVPENGVIKIPKKFRDRITTGVKVILIEKKAGNLNDDEAYEASPVKRTDSLSPVSIDTRGWKFDKEEANER